MCTLTFRKCALVPKLPYTSLQDGAKNNISKCDYTAHVNTVAPKFVILVLSITYCIYYYTIRCFTSEISE